MPKIVAYCDQCRANLSSNVFSDELTFHVTELNDDNVYRFNCKHGHENIFRLLNLRYDLLFEIGANAIFDGYYREATSSFASSLERFMEYFLEVVSGENRNGGPIHAGFFQAGRQLLRTAIRCICLLLPATLFGTDAHALTKYAKVPQ